MTLRIVFKSGYHFDILRAKPDVLSDALERTAEKANEAGTTTNFMLLTTVDSGQMWINMNELAAIHPIADAEICPLGKNCPITHAQTKTAEAPPAQKTP